MTSYLHIPKKDYLFFKRHKTNLLASDILMKASMHRHVEILKSYLNLSINFIFIQ